MPDEVPWRDYVDAMFAESRRATEIAERERATAALALRSEQQRAGETAEREREKAAQALASALTQSIREGDERLREHIQNQVEQINAALEAARRETGLTHESSEKAIAKAEAANERRFDSVNAFREQLAEQAAAFLPREVADAQFAETGRRIATNSDALSKIRGTYVTVEAFDARLETLRAQVAEMHDKLGKLT